MTQDIHEGRCLCGAVRFTARGPAKWTSYCHCHSCRKQTGAPVAAYAGFERGQVAFQGQAMALYASSPGVLRGFCPTCGSALTFEGERWPGEVHLHVGAFDTPGAFPPTDHAHAGERVDWVRISDPPMET